MSRNVINVIVVLALMGVSAVAGVLVYTWSVGGEAEPTTELVAPTIPPSATPDGRDDQIASLATEVANLQAQNAELQAEVTSLAAALTATAEAAETTPEATAEAAEATPEATPEAAPEAVEATPEATTEAAETTPEATAEAAETTPEATAEAAETTPEAVLFEIVQDESQVRFILTEDLRGVFTTVVGATNQVAGQIFVAFNTPADSRLGGIRINARTLATDNRFRDGAIRDQILESRQDRYEFIDFTPTEITGLPQQIAIGEAVTFQVAGDLKIREIVRPVTFEVTVTVESEDRLSGSAKTTVQRSDFGLRIPNVPGVANVSEAVDLEITFVAARVES